MDTVMATGTEDTMQSNAIDTNSDEMDLDLIQLFIDILQGLRKHGWFIAALASVVGHDLFLCGQVSVYALL